MTAAESSFTSALERAAAVPRAGEPAFAAALRAAGREEFLKVKLPTPKHEDWRFTNLSGVAAQPFAPAVPRRVLVGDLPAAPRLVFVNGHLDREASDLTGLPSGVRMGSLSAALRERPQVVEPHLGRVAPARDRAFAALNLALFEDGALIEIDAEVSCSPVLQLVFLSAPGAPSAAHTRNLVLAGPGARATLVEHYRGEGTYLVNTVTELVLGAGADVEHDRLQEDAPQAYHFGALQVEQGAGSRLTGQSIALGGQLARVEARALLAAEGAICDLNGLYIGGGSQVLDHWVYVDHASPRCTSRELFKGILGGSSRGVFAGRIHVREGAQKTDAGQVNSNLLLSDDATVDAKPQLEILADDVQCAHGGTVGQLRAEQLFYLRARGIPEALARAMLTWAFASEMVALIGPEALRERVRRAVTARLPDGAMLQEIA